MKLDSIKPFFKGSRKYGTIIFGVLPILPHKKDKSL